MNRPLSFPKTIGSFLVGHKHVLPFLFAFVLWCWPFFDFLRGRLAIQDDAISYYDHIKFFIDNMLHGVFPLWDPTWFYGLPNDFFLRRFNPYNPFYFVLFLLRLVGIPHYPAYISFLVAYFFLGTIGFYRCCRILFKDRLTAFLAFLLLLFSSIGTRIFDSYMILLITPTLWFYYFLLAFARKQKPKQALGLTFCLMLLLNTYLPFYFLIIFLCFVVIFILAHPKGAWTFIKGSGHFIRSRPLWALFCVILIAIAIIPGLTFMASGETGEFVLPGRYGGADANVLTVNKQWTMTWGVWEEFLYSSYYPHFEDRTFAIILIPVFSILLALLGLLTKINRTLILLFLWASVLFLLSAPYFSPLYNFLYTHLSIFKFFKNLHFFFWFGILPISCVYLAALGEQIFRFRVKGVWKNLAASFCLLAVLAGIGFSHYQWGHHNITTYLTLALSLAFFLLLWNGFFPRRYLLASLFLTAVVALQPMEAFLALSRNTPPYLNNFSYDQPFDFKTFRNSDPGVPGTILSPQGRKPIPLYICSRRYNELRDHIPHALPPYLIHRFIAYDHVAPLPPGSEAYVTLARTFLEGQNLAYLPPGRAQEENPSTGTANPPWYISENSGTFRILHADANSLKIRTNFPTKKFLVFNDTFHPLWRAWINGVARPVLPANLAFKGLWVDAGEQIITFRFGTTRMYLENYLLLFLFYAVFLFLVWPRRHNNDKAFRDA